MYIPKTDTITNWGDFPTEGAPIPLEFDYYLNHYDPGLGGFSLSESQVEKLFTTSFILRGLNNMYNANSFSVNWHCQRQAQIIQWQKRFDIGNVYNFALPLQYMVQEYVL